MPLVNTQEGRTVDDRELKLTTARSKPFAAWIESNILNVPNIVKRVKRTRTISASIDNYTLSTDPKLMAFGYTIEQLSEGSISSRVVTHVIRGKNLKGEREQLSRMNILVDTRAGF